MKCLLCRSNRTEFVFRYKGKDVYLKKLDIRHFDLQWFQCKRCRVYFSKQYGKIESVYANDHLYDAQFDKNSIKTRFHKIMDLNDNESDNAFRVKRVKEFHKRYYDEPGVSRRPFNILDIGAGLGVFLAKFLDDNYRGYALEINKVAANHIKEEINVPVYGDLIQNLTTDMKYDLITMNKVVEHIKSPIEVLKSVKRLLYNKGIIYVELPDVRSYEMDGDTSDAFASGHYTVYNSDSVFHLLSMSGFEILKIDRILEPSGKLTIYSFARGRSI